MACLIDGNLIAAIIALLQCVRGGSCYLLCCGLRGRCVCGGGGRQESFGVYNGLLLILADDHDDYLC